MHVKVVLLIVALFQGCNTETVRDVTAALALKITAVKINIDAVITELIRQAHVKIGVSIGNGEAIIEDQLDEVDNIITEAEQEARDKGVDITKCVSSISEALEQVNFQKIQNCAKGENLNLLGTELGHVRLIKKRLSNSINRCLSTNPHDAPGLRTCVQSDIDTAQNEVREIQDNNANIYRETPKQAFLCVEESVDDLDKLISSAAHNLKNCLEEILQ